MADGINKCVPNRAEIEGAVNRLLSVGLIRIENGRFVVPQAARLVLDQVCQSAKSVFDEWDMLEKYFTQADLPGVSYTPWHLSESEFAAACEIYQKDFMGPGAQEFEQSKPYDLKTRRIRQSLDAI